MVGFSDETVVQRTVEFGNRVTLPCQTAANRTVAWTFRESPEQPVNELVLQSKPINGWVTQFEIEKVGDGETNLVLLNATFNNTGYYRCIDENGLGDVLAYIRLTVIMHGRFIFRYFFQLKHAALAFLFRYWNDVGL